jgi:RecA-family ATPase
LPREVARATGKTADLAFGFMGGPGAWEKLAPPGDTSTEDEIKQRQRAWRNAHPHTVRFWGAINRAAIQAVRKPGIVIGCGRLAFKSDGDFLRMKLPSGRKIAYPFPRLTTTKFGDLAVVFMDNAGGKFTECRYGQGAYGGTWIENAVQGIARDVFAAAIQRLEAVGYPITLHVHDEIVAEVPDGFGSSDEFLNIITTPPPWADGLPIAAKVRNGQRFCKTTPAAESATMVETVQPSVGFLGDAEIPGETSERTGEAPNGSRLEHNPAAAPLMRFTTTAPIVTVAASTPPPQDEEPPPRGNGYGYPHGEQERGRQTNAFVYRSADGSPYLQVRKFAWVDGDGKRRKAFPQFHRENGCWVKGKPVGPHIPYRLPELLTATPDAWIDIMEGEKDADRGADLGLTTTTNPEGAEKWHKDLNEYFRGRRVRLHEDNDAAGRAHVAKTANMLCGIAKEIAVVRYPEQKEGGDFSDFMDNGGTLKAMVARARAAEQLQPFPFINMSNWDSEPVPEQQWIVPGRIPRRQSVIFSGEGGAGKSIIQLHLSAAAVLGCDWLGAIPEQGPALFIDCEDDRDVMHYRLAAIARNFDTCFTDLIDGGLHLTSLVGQDTVMATVSRNGIVEPTPLYNQLLQAAGDIKPTMIGIAASANVFAGDENNRTQVQQFVNLTTRLAIISNGAVVLITHPSITGINTGSGLSGTTQWHNAVRARFYLKGVKAEPGEQPDNDLREIEFKKNQYGAMAENIPLRWQDGMFLPLDGATFDRAEQEARAEDVFLELLRRFNAENRYVSSSLGSTYAPALFAREDKARKAGTNSASLTAAMRRLFAAGKIHNEPHGRPSRPRFHLAIKP